MTLAERIIMVILAVALLAGCQTSSEQKNDRWPGATKIKFPLDNINADGLRGHPDALLAVSYEFCIPASERVYQEVLRIDPSVNFNPGSRGRIGCAKDQALSIGQTHQDHWREILKELSSQTYIVEIRECFFE
jgi:hypothetical protein